MLTQAEMADLVDRIIKDNRQSLDKMGGKAFGLVMGLVMKEARGKADPAIVSELTKKRLR
jgi:Glu-tRNA(Gln) amidotransferase subunit E-like FAD-binding protein